jgi:hypothetical protein
MKFIISLTLIFVTCTVTIAQVTTNKINQISNKNIPVFETYPSKGSIRINDFVKINPNSNKSSLDQLQWAIDNRGLEIGGTANFASNYQIIDFGVGTGCFQAVMIDLRDGKVYGVPVNCPACTEGNEDYIDFKVNSLLFVNTYCLASKKKAYFIWNEDLKKFQSVK